MVGPCLNAIITVLALQSVDEMSFWYLGGLGETQVISWNLFLTVFGISPHDISIGEREDFDLLFALLFNFSNTIFFPFPFL